MGECGRGGECGFLRSAAGISFDEEMMAFTCEERRTEIMPVLESTDKIAPRSVLRHRPIAEGGAEPGKNPAKDTITKGNGDQGRLKNKGYLKTACTSTALPGNRDAGNASTVDAADKCNCLV